MIIVTAAGKLSGFDIQKFNESTAKYVDSLFKEITKDCSKEARVIVNEWWSGKSTFTEEYRSLPHYEEAYGYIMTLISNGLG